MTDRYTLSPNPSPVEGEGSVVALRATIGWAGA